VRSSPKKRRTQEERREGTIRKLLDATTDALIELGYAETTVQQICARAEVSTGGLFRHFASREELLVAVGEDVGKRLLEQYRGAFETLSDEEDPLELALHLVRDACRSRLNQAMYELSMAARTNPRLKKALAPSMARYFDDIVALGQLLLPELAAQLGPRFRVLVETILAVFDGETVHRFVEKRPQLEEQRMELLLGITRMLVGERHRR
jgi:AcrR family transcriptional regulator